MAQIRWSYILVFVAFAIFMVTWHQAFQVTPTFLSQFKTETALLSEKNTCMHPVTIVSAYYPLNNSKHSLNEYDKWMANFFSYVSAPIVMYSSPGEALDKIRDLRGDLPMTVKLQELWEIPVLKPHRTELENRQYDLDPEKDIHNANLYAIWNAKSWMVQQAATDDSFQSDYFFWVDAGAWRIQPLSNWPDTNKIKQLYGRNDTKGDEIILGSPMLQKGTPYIQGTFFGGSKAAIHWWAAEYFRLFNDWLDKGIFAGKDQELMTDIFNRNRHRAVLLRSMDIDSQLWNVWFFFQPFFARSASIANGIKQGLQLDFKNVWDSQYLIPAERDESRR